MAGKGADIRKFFQPKTEQVSTACSLTLKQEKEENDSVSGEHSHSFFVTFNRSSDKNNIQCQRPRTVLQAIKSSRRYTEKIICSDEFLIIERGTGDEQNTIPTHFPCSLIKENDTLTVWQKREVIEKSEDQDENLYTASEYVIFYIDKDPGKNFKKAKIFKSNLLKDFKNVCVYAPKGLTVEQALKRDGRFADDLDDFYLEDVEEKNALFDSTLDVEGLNNKKFKICRRLKRIKNIVPAGDLEARTQTGQDKHDTSRLLKIAHQKGGLDKIRKKTAAGANSSEELRLKEKCQELRKQLEEALKNRSYQKELESKLEWKKENFGKIQQSFNEFHRVEKLVKHGKSVCKIVVEDRLEGTGFVLFDNYILTNEHLFSDTQNLDQVIYAIFDYDEPDPNTDMCSFTCENTLVHSDSKLDYAILKLNNDGKRITAKKTPKRQKVQIPPGLLPTFAEVPKTGEACLVGHPGGNIKMIDPTCIIEAERRVDLINQHLKGLQNMHPFIAISVINKVKDQLEAQHIEEIFKGGNKAENATYETFMLHGSSGSPVFDTGCRVFGLHTGGYFHDFPVKEQVIQWAGPVLAIFDDFVSHLKHTGKEELLERMLRGAQFLTPDPRV